MSLSLETIVAQAEAGGQTAHDHDPVGHLHAKVAAQIEAICRSGTSVSISGLGGVTLDQKLADLQRVASLPREDAIQELQRLHSILPR